MNEVVGNQEVVLKGSAPAMEGEDSIAHIQNSEEMGDGSNPGISRINLGAVRAATSNADYCRWAYLQTGAITDFRMLEANKLQEAIQQVAQRGATRGDHL